MTRASPALLQLVAKITELRAISQAAAAAAAANNTKKTSDTLADIDFVLGMSGGTGAAPALPKEATTPVLLTAKRSATDSAVFHSVAVAIYTVLMPTSVSGLSLPSAHIHIAFFCDFFVPAFFLVSFFLCVFACAA